MTETQRRIKAYQELLPALRERIIAVALLLAMSVSMLSSASFAWLTLSRNPEITAVNTTVAANGNLEIALATGDRYTATAPGDSQVGDSTATKGQSVTAANITWGNLVNLADPSYGLDKMVLRPATLNQSSLLDSPLYGATYGDDGRTTNLSSDFAYATWEPGNAEEGISEGFSINNKLGVRAITSIVYKESEGIAYQKMQKEKAAMQANLTAGQKYLDITKDNALMGSLATVMGSYLTGSLDSSQNPKVNKDDIFNLSEIFRLFIEAYELQIDAMVKLANYQLFVMNNTEAGSTPYTEYTADTLITSTNTESYLKNQKGIYLPGLDQMKLDHAKLKKFYSSDEIDNDMMDLVERSKSETLYYDAMAHIVDQLVNVGTCKVGNKTVNQLSADKSAAASLVMQGGTHEVAITNGVLYNFETLNGARANIKNMSVKAHYIIDVTLNANITTSAKAPSQFQNGLDQYADQGGAMEGYSEDTYGLAIDMWLRTNALDSYLTLEGNVLTETTEVNPTLTVSEEVYVVKLTTVNDQGESVTADVEVYEKERGDGTKGWFKVENQEEVTDLQGKIPQKTIKTVTYDLYTLSVSDEDENGEEFTYTVDVYEKRKNSGVKAWFNAASHTEVAAADLEGHTPIRKVERVETVIGYEGENRIWDRDKNALISSEAVTQGSGSCYVYYADTPEDQARSLELLESFKVAFIDDMGELLATASMDTEHFYASTGRVIVPLKLDQSTSIDLGDDGFGNTSYAITPLTQNEPIRITALVYLDGSDLYNSDVLAAADIQGRLNIQFGTSGLMEPARNTELEDKILHITAEITKKDFSFDDADSDMTTTVKVTADGAEPSTVTAFFLREINSTQGSREGTMNFTKDEATGKWVADYTFTAPGKYVLRSVQLDGVEYDLDVPLEANVEGFAIDYLTCDDGAVNVMTVDGSYTTGLKLKFATDDVSRMPSSVQGRYLREDGTAVNVNFTYNSGGTNAGIWTGNATFVASGDYTMRYLLLDGEYVELPSASWQTANLKLGMRVAVYTDSPTNFLYTGDDLSADKQTLAMRVRILDNSGEDVGAQPGVYLYYGKRGTSDLLQGLSAQLEWDPAQECYTGMFNSKPGIYEFAQVTVSGDTLSAATVSPVFTIVSPILPTFGADNTNYPTQVAMNGATAEMKVAINNCDTTFVYAILEKKGASEPYTVLGTLSDGNWHFPIPRDQEGNQDGIWKIRQIEISGVYDPDGNEYSYTSEKGPLILTSNEFKELKVISQIKVTVTPIADSTLGKDENGTITGKFMEGHKVSGLTVTVQDLYEDALDGNVEVSLVYNYQNNPGDYGHYTSNAEVKPIKVTMKKSADGKTFVQEKDFYVHNAGSYQAALKYTINGAEKEAPAGEAQQLNFAVYSAKPKLTVSAVSPAAGTTFSTTKSIDGNITEIKNVSNYAVSNYATVYLKAAKSSWGFWGYTVPTVTMQLEGLAAPDGDKGTLTATTSATMINAADTSTKHVFNFSTANMSNGIMSATSSIGRSEGVTLSHDRKYLAGKTTFETLNVSYGANTFTVILAEPVTIEQPEAPYTLSYIRLPDEVRDEDRPESQAANGSKLTVKFPIIEYEVKTTKDPTYSDPTSWTAANVVHTDYVFGDGWFSDVYRYYDWTRYSRYRTVTGETDTQKFEIYQWTITDNGVSTTYTAGQTYNIEVTGDVSAVPSMRAKGGKTTTTETYNEYEYQYGYAARSGTFNGIPEGVTHKIGEYSFRVSDSNSVKPKLYPDWVTKDETAYEAAWP